jgi:hypothetical protein
MAKERKSSSKSSNGANLGFEQKLWQATDKLRGHACSARRVFCGEFGAPAEYGHALLEGYMYFSLRDTTLRKAKP